jgi:hypothetical protein
MKTVAIVYGWAEGDWQSRKFENELAKKGFRLVSNIKEADIIFAHSSGCYLVPKNNKAQSVFLVGLPYWPGRSLAASVVYKLTSEIKYHRKNEGLVWWLGKIAHNTWYILSRPRSSFYLLTHHKQSRLPVASKKSKVVLVRPSDDPMCHPKIMKMLSLAKTYKFIEIPGAHDDCWIKPKEYIALIQQNS